MKKLFLSIVLAYVSSFSTAQGNQDLSKLELPSVAPVSPEAASLGKYGDLPVNLASGRIDYSIPIYTIKEAGFELPVYLSYNHSGLLAEEDPGLVGLGWTLHAGGMIVRQLRGKPDEGSLGYVAGNIGKDYVVPFIEHGFSNMSAEAREAHLNNFFRKASSNVMDSQPDKFVINAGTLSANFYHNEDGDIIFRPHKNYQITKPTANSYRIIDDNGITYDFAYPEETTSEPITDNEQLAPPMIYNSAWALSKISLPTSDQTIDFEYTQEDDYHKQGISKSYRELIMSNGQVDSYSDFFAGHLISSSCTNAQSVITSYMETTVAGKNQISKITFPDGELHFDVRTAPAGSLNATNSYLHSISLYDNFDNKIKSYEFTYDNVNSNFKLLTKVEVLGQNDTEDNAYELAYYGTPPSIINSDNQDVWGYYSTTLLNSNYNNTLLGRKVTNFNTTLLGALKRITYPTFRLANRNNYLK